MENYSPSLQEYCPIKMDSFVASLPKVFDLRNTLEQIEKTLISRALCTARGVQAEAARNLGISRSDMAYKLKKYDLHHS